MNTTINVILYSWLIQFYLENLRTMVMMNLKVLRKNIITNTNITKIKNDRYIKTFVLI